MISIIVPCYNVEKYLVRCLDSILSQTNQNYEVILVDDGSRDGSGKICDDYAERYEKFRAFHKENGGLADARNFGLHQVNGEYVSFLDSDDWISPDYIETLETCIGKYGTLDHIRFGYFIDYTENNYTIDKKYPAEMDAQTKDDVADTIRTAESMGMFNCVWGGCYRYQIIKENSLAFLQHSEPGEDLLFNCTFFKLVDHCLICTKQLYHYMRQGEKTMTKKYDEHLYEKIQYFDRAREDLYTSLGMNTQADKESVLDYYHKYVMSCIYNLYGSDNKTVDRRAFLQTVLTDKRHEMAMSLIEKGEENGLYEKIFASLYKKGNAAKMDRTYRVLFFLRNKYKGLYNIFRKNFFKKR